MAEQILKFISKQREDDASLRLGAELAAMFAGELNPVAPKAQRKVPLPEGLDLDAWINEPPTPTRPGSGSDALCSGHRGEGSAASAGGARKGAGGKSKRGSGAGAAGNKAGAAVGAGAGAGAGGGRFFALGNAFGSDSVSGDRHSATNESKRPEPSPEELDKVLCLLMFLH